MRKPTLRDIAEKAGLSVTAVSLAMRGSNRVSAEKRQIIKTIALELGYKRDPMMSALCSYRDTIRPKINNSNIYFLQFGDEAQSLLDQGTVAKDFWNGALDETKNLGYSLNKIWIGDPILNPSRVHSILKSRGVAGLVVYQANCPIINLQPILKDFSLIWLGDGPKEASLHCVRINRFSSMKLAWENLSRLGYKNSGLILAEHSLDQNYGEWEAAHNHFQQKFTGSTNYIPPLTFKSNEDCNAAVLNEWVQQWNLEVVVSAFPRVYNLLQDLDIRIPQDLGYLSLTTEINSEVSGIDQQTKSIAKTGVRLLDQLICNREQGIPQHQQVIETNGEWNSGRTLRSLV